MTAAAAEPSACHGPSAGAARTLMFGPLRQAC